MSETITKARVGELVHAALSELNALGGEARPQQIFQNIEGRLKLSTHERSAHKSGAVRWSNLIRWYTIDCVKAGWLIKKDGRWFLTDSGKAALKLSPTEFIQRANKLYRTWAKDNEKKEERGERAEAPDAVAVESAAASAQSAYEQAIESSRQEIEDRIDGLDPYEFQKLVASLLAGMGFHIARIAPPGKDGGIDIDAYQDPIGVKTPRIKVQVKHREDKASVKEIRELKGLLNKDGDTGLFVSSGGFSSDAISAARDSDKHIELIDLGKLLRLWEEHYEKIPESGRKLLPLVKLFFLAPTEE